MKFYVTNADGLVIRQGSASTQRTAMLQADKQANEQVHLGEMPDDAALYIPSMSEQEKQVNEQHHRKKRKRLRLLDDAPIHRQLNALRAAVIMLAELVDRDQLTAEQLQALEDLKALDLVISSRD